MADVRKGADARTLTAEMLWKLGISGRIPVKRKYQPEKSVRGRIQTYLMSESVNICIGKHFLESYFSMRQQILSVHN